MYDINFISLRFIFSSALNSDQRIPSILLNRLIPYQLPVMSTTERQSEGLGSEQSSQLEKQDAVDWDGPDDPANPFNWSQTKKNMHVIFVSVFTLYAYGFLPNDPGNWFIVLSSNIQQKSSSHDVCSWSRATDI